jgi:hypothetical protein
MQLDFLFLLAAAVAEKQPAVYESFFSGLTQLWGSSYLAVVEN